MPDTIILTVCYQQKQYDFELPSGLPLSAWEASFRLLLKECFPGIKLDGREIQLYYEGKRLKENHTLKQWGIYDGSYLVLEVK